jgi:hypothetical protein
MTIIAGPIGIPYNSPQQKALASAENRTSVCGIKIDSYNIRLNHKAQQKKGLDARRIQSWFRANGFIQR